MSHLQADLIRRADLIRAGEALYGERWHTPLARDLGVSYRTMCRWVAGDAPVRYEAFLVVKRLVQERIAKLQRVAGFLDEHMG